jgi:hypothetical protein
MLNGETQCLVVPHCASHVVRRQGDRADGRDRRCGNGGTTLAG